MTKERYFQILKEEGYKSEEVIERMWEWESTLIQTDGLNVPDDVDEQILRYTLRAVAERIPIPQSLEEMLQHKGY